jgi:hypothetical protein
MTNRVVAHGGRRCARGHKGSADQEGEVVIGHWSLVIGQWSVVSGQWSVVSGQWSVVSCQLSVVSGQWSVVSGHWSVVSGHWSVVSGQWSLVIGHWSVVSCQLSVVIGQLLVGGGGEEGTMKSAGDQNHVSSSRIKSPHWILRPSFPTSRSSRCLRLPVRNHPVSLCAKKACRDRESRQAGNVRVATRGQVEPTTSSE